MSISFNPLLLSGLQFTGVSSIPIGMPITGSDPNSLLGVDASNKLKDVVLTDGQLLIGSTGSFPVATQLTGTTNQVNITNAAGSITLSLPQSIALTSTPTFGGLTITGLSGPVKASSGVLSSSAIDLSTSEVTGILTVDKGGTNLNGSAAPNGHILIGNGTGYTLREIDGTTNQVNVTNGAGTITLSLPQDIATTSSPTFSNISLVTSGVIDTSAGGTLGFGTTNANIINIGNPLATINMQGSTIYQNVTNLNVTDKNIIVNYGGSIGSGAASGIHVQEGAVEDAGYLEVTGDRLGWVLKAPAVAGTVVVHGGTSGILLDQSSHNPVTIDAINGNGLHVSNQVLSLDLSNASSTGALSSTDWQTFNNKEPAIAAGTTAQYWRGDKSWRTLDTSVVPENGNLYYLNSRVYSALSGTAPISFSSGVISISQATTSTNGYLSSTDWNTFNNKQPAGNYITDLTGDVTASGPGSVVATLKNVGTAGTYAKVTTDSKGRVTSGIPQISLTSDVNGILPFSNGGLGFSSGQGANRVIGFDASNIGLESKAISAGTGIAITNYPNNIVITNSFGAVGDIGSTPFYGLLNNTANQVITGLSFSNGVSSFVAQLFFNIYGIPVNYTQVELRGINRGGSNWVNNEIQFNYIGDHLPGLDFSISAGGQVLVSLGNVAGFISGGILFRASVLS